MSEAKPQWIEVETVFECEVKPEGKWICPRDINHQGKCAIGTDFRNPFTGCPYAIDFIQKKLTGTRGEHGKIEILVSSDKTKVKGIKTFDSGEPSFVIGIHEGEIHQHLLETNEVPKTISSELKTEKLKEPKLTFLRKELPAVS